MVLSKSSARRLNVVCLGRCWVKFQEPVRYLMAFDFLPELLEVP